VCVAVAIAALQKWWVRHRVSLPKRAFRRSNARRWRSSIPMQKGGMALQALSLLFAELNGVKRGKLTQ
jgi:hypothetical protein